MKKYFGLLLMLGVFCINANAQNEQKEIKSFSLAQAVDFAKKNNYSLKSNMLDVMASEKKVKEVLATGLPQINATGNFTNNTTIGVVGIINIPPAPPFPAKFGQPYSASGSITATQLIFDGGFLMGLKAANEYVNLAKLNVNRNIIETEVNVTKAYYLALLLQTNVNLLGKNIETLDKTRGDLEKLYKNGFSEKTDFDRVTLQYSTLSLQRDKVMDQQKIAMMILKLQMGMNVNDSIVLTDELQKMYENTKNPLVESKIDYTKRTEYQLLNQQIRLQDFDRKRILFGYTPTLSAIAATQRNTFDTVFSSFGNKWYPGTYWGLNLTIPIFDGLRKSAQIQQAKINLAKYENDKKNLENTIEQQVLQAKLSFARAGQQIELQRKNMELAQDIYDRVQIKYKNGVGSSLELTTSQNDLETARQNFLSNVYDYFVAQIELRKSIGDIK